MWIKHKSVDQSHHRPSPKSSPDPGTARHGPARPWGPVHFGAHHFAQHVVQHIADDCRLQTCQASAKQGIPEDQAAVSNLCKLGGKCGSAWSWFCMACCDLLLLDVVGIPESRFLLGCLDMPGWCDTSGALENGSPWLAFGLFFQHLRCCPAQWGWFIFQSHEFGHEGHNASTIQYLGGKLQMLLVHTNSFTVLVVEWSHFLWTPDILSLRVLSSPLHHRRLLRCNVMQGGQHTHCCAPVLFHFLCQGLEGLRYCWGGGTLTWKIA